MSSQGLGHMSVNCTMFYCSWGLVQGQSIGSQLCTISPCPLRVRVYTDLYAFANIKDNSHVCYLDWTLDREVLSADNRGQKRNRCNTEFSDLSGSLGDLFLLKFPSVKFFLFLLCSSTLPQLWQGWQLFPQAIGPRGVERLGFIQGHTHWQRFSENSKK